MKRLANILRKLNEGIGKTVSFLVLAMMATTCYEVIARYAFNAPTIWSLDLNNYMLCVYSLLGGGFALVRGGHVNVDILYGRFKPRTKAVVDVLTSSFFFLFIGVLLWLGSKMAYHALVQKEVSPSLLGWPLFPFKVMVPIGALLIFLWGILKFVNDLITAITGKAPVEMRAEEIFGAAKKD